MKQKNIFFISIVGLFLFLYSYYLSTNFIGMGDNLYLYNRAWQMFDCIKNGHLPNFYYNDMIGYGYGSSFFYGQLTLLPFCIFLNNPKLFMASYVFSILILNFFGFRFFAKQYTKNYEFCTFLYTFNCLIISYLIGTFLFSSILNVGFSWFLLGYGVKFFRDKNEKSLYLISIFYFLMINTHLVSTVIAILVLFYIFVLYFDKNRIKNYIKLFIFSLSVSLFWLSRMIWQLNICDNTKAINSNVLSIFKETDNLLYFQGNFPFLGIIDSGILKNIDFFKNLNIPKNIFGYSYFNFGIFLCILIYLIIKRPELTINKKTISSLLIILFLSIISTKNIWLNIYDKLDLIIQFPLRYVPYIVGFLILFIFKDTDFNLKFEKYLQISMIILIVPDILIFASFSKIVKTPDFTIPEFREALIDIKNNNELEINKLINVVDAELIAKNYLSKKFDNNYNIYENYNKAIVIDENGNETIYPIERIDNKIKVYIDNNYINSTLRFPKVYYYGYKGFNNNKEIVLNNGYSQLVEYKGNINGEYVIYWQMPLILYILEIFSIYVLCICIYKVLQIYKST